MKKIKILFLIFSISLFSQNASSMISKKNAEKVQFWTMVLAAIDQFELLNKYKDILLPKNRTFTPFGGIKINVFDPQLKIEVPKKFKFLQFNAPQDATFQINPLILANKTLISALEKDWDLLPILIDFFIRVETLRQALNENPNSDDGLKELVQIEGIVFATEKIAELVAHLTLNATMKNQKILKRLSRVILFTAINTLGTYLRKLVASQLADPEKAAILASGQKFPVVGTTLVDKFLENLMVETFAELLQRFIIADPEKQKLEEKKKKFQEKLEDIIAASKKDKKSETKSLEEKKSFNSVPVAI